MAYAQDTFRAAAGASRGRSAGLWTAIAERIAQYRLYRNTLKELDALSDRDLADLGLHRSQIRDVAMDAAQR